MKNLIKFFTKVLKIAVIVAVVAAVCYAGYSYYKNSDKTSVVENSTTQSEYDERVEDKMVETADDWKAKHKVWAEQEISREIIEEQELKLESLREKELSL